MLMLYIVIISVVSIIIGVYIGIWMCPRPGSSVIFDYSHCPTSITLTNDNYHQLCNPYKQLADECHRTSCGNITNITNPKPFVKQDDFEISAHELVYTKEQGYINL